jgi:hypothetical protein
LTSLIRVSWCILTPTYENKIGKIKDDCQDVRNSGDDDDTQKKENNIECRNVVLDIP